MYPCYLASAVSSLAILAWQWSRSSQTALPEIIHSSSPFSTFSYVRALFQILLNESLSSKFYPQIPHYDDVEIYIFLSANLLKIENTTTTTKKKSYLCKYSLPLPLKLRIKIPSWQHGYSITIAAQCPVCWATLSIATFLAPVPWRISKASQ